MYTVLKLAFTLTESLEPVEHFKFPLMLFICVFNCKLHVYLLFTDYCVSVCVRVYEYNTIVFSHT